MYKYNAIPRATTKKNPHTDIQSKKCSSHPQEGRKKEQRDQIEKKNK